MKRLLFALAACTALLAVPIVSAATLDNVITTQTDNVFQDDFAGHDAATLVAVDETISALCRPGADPTYQRPGGFCDAVAAYSTKSVYSDGFKAPCPLGQEPNPTPPPTCVPI